MNDESSFIIKEKNAFFFYVLWKMVFSFDGRRASDGSVADGERGGLQRMRADLIGRRAIPIPIEDRRVALLTSTFPTPKRRFQTLL